MWTRSAQNKETGKFLVEAFDYDGNLSFRGEFATMQEADAAGQNAERINKMTTELDKRYGKPVEMSDDELLAELGV
jgi:hypothetical protein